MSELILNAVFSTWHMKRTGVRFETDCLDAAPEDSGSWSLNRFFLESVYKEGGTRFCSLSFRPSTGRRVRAEFGIYLLGAVHEEGRS
jgi:hypothetical protein